MCVDYRGLSKLTIRDNYPLPLIDDCIEYLDGKNYFSVLDLKDGLHQVKMEDDYNTRRLLRRTANTSF